MNDERIIIEKGDVFEGTWEQLQDCFGVSRETIIAWCEYEKWDFEIKAKK